MARFFAYTSLLFRNLFTGGWRKLAPPAEYCQLRYWRTPLATIEADIRTARHQSPPERREHERHQVGYAGRLTFGTLSYHCTVVDLSVGGAQLSIGETILIRPWTVVTLHIENFGAFHGRAVWSRGDRHGIQFFDVARAVMQRAASGG